MDELNEDVIDSFIFAHEARLILKQRDQFILQTIKEISDKIKNYAQRGRTELNIDLPFEIDDLAFDFIRRLLISKGYVIKEENRPFTVLAKRINEKKQVHGFVISWEDTKEDATNE